ncbi:remorin 1.4 isoform X2 [Ricinus communis]|uniref:remorin 1.4 isoform X2 n=1 Tax=Ricinus communis TaxID=3988 RepID=UPI00201A7C8F|nr:remorin 1.4 isoform X2 [Ricinus communis]
MEHLIKQTTRVRFTGQQSTGAPGSSKERRIPVQKTPSFKEEKKRPQNWFRRQISWKMNQNHDSNGIERAIAVAAAAYVIASLEESSTPEQKKIGDGTEPSLTPIKSRKEEITVSRPEPEIEESKVPETAPTEEKSPVKVVGPASSMKKAPTFTDKRGSSMKKTLSFTDKPALPMKKVPAFAEEQLSRSDDIEPESLKQKTAQLAIRPEIEAPKPDWRIPTKPATSPAKVDRQTSTKPESGGTEADAWERSELAKIKKKYDALEARILSWENKKKKKSRHRLDKSEGELERKRLKALERFRSEVEDVNQIAEGARSKARKEQQNEELKAKEKANKCRKAGKVPTTCFGF